MSKVEIIALIICAILFLAWLMTSLLQGSHEAEFNYPTQRIKEWSKGLAECDTVVSIIGQITDRRDKCILVGNSAVCYFNRKHKYDHIRMGDYVEVVGSVFLNGDTLQLNECRLAKRSQEDTIK